MTDNEPYVEVREYISTIYMFFDGDGNLLGEDPQNDMTWHDTRETRPMTDDEREDWGG